MGMLHKILFFLLILLLPTQFGYHFWPEWSMVLGRRVDYLSPTMYLTDVLLIILIVFWLIQYKLRISPCLPAGRNYELRIFGFLFVFILINIFYAKNQYVAVYAWIKVIEFVLLGTYIYRERIRLADIVLPYSLAMLYSSLLAIAQFVHQGSIGGILYFLGERMFTIATPGIARTDVWGEFLRPYATFPHPNVLGGFLAVGILFIIRHIHTDKKYYAFIIAVSCIVLVLTFSRSAWIALAIGLMLMNKRLIFFSVAFLLCVIMMLPSVTSESVAVRGQLNQAALSMWFQSPFVGVGAGNFLVALPDHLVSRQIYFLQPVHNIFLLLLSEVGILGVLFIIYFLFRITNYELRITKKFIYIFPIVIIGLFDHYFLTLQQGLLVTVLSLGLYLTENEYSIQC